MKSTALLLAVFFAMAAVSFAGLEITINPSMPPGTKKSQTDFFIAISNPGPATVNIAGDWGKHILLVDRQPYSIMQTMWWCVQSPKIKPDAQFKRMMLLNYYQKLSLKAGRHELQFQLGGVLSEKAVIMLDHDFTSTAGAGFSAQR